MTVEQALAKMLERFEDGKRWAPCHAADAEGNPVKAWDDQGHSRKAQRVCVIAMASQVTGGPFRNEPLLDAVQERLCRAAGLQALVELPAWNDSRTSFGEVAVAIRAAIEDGK